MDPQWNLLQPLISESAVLDYNNGSGNVHQRNFGRYNNFYDSTTNCAYSSFLPPPTTCTGVYLRSNNSSLYSQSSQTSLCASKSTTSSMYYSGQNHEYPQITDFKIGTYSHNSGQSSDSNDHKNSSGYSSQSNSAYSQNSSNSGSNQNVRETGIIEKLLQTYGFIQCCERQARLFFHFSQFDGNTEHLHIGDPVEFEVTFDKRTGKPIASSVTKISPEVVLSEERVIGIVTTELRPESGGEQQGRITYENRGECFFLPYGKEDVEGYVTLKPGDRVSFQIATNQRSGNLAARHVRLENPIQPVKYQGVICTMKDSYGFIERADVVDEIFFHFSETKSIPGGLKLGDDVEFLIQTRNGKEVATDMVKLPPGTVVFEDLEQEVKRGQVLKPVEKNPRQNQKDALTGRIRYRGGDRSEIEVKFGERDQKGDFTLRHGDWVQFNIATDRRDHLHKATNISLLDESFVVSGEKREQAVITSLKDGYGYVSSPEREKQIYFDYGELLDPERDIHLNDEVEVTIAQDQGSRASNRLSAIRIKLLEPGTVKFETVLHEEVEGEVVKGLFDEEDNDSDALSDGSVSSLEKSQNVGMISYELNSVKMAVPFYARNCTENVSKGDKVLFSLCEVKKTKELLAMCIKLKVPPPSPSSSSVVATASSTSSAPPSSAPTSKRLPTSHQGFIAALKETFGFIETKSHDREIFFHFSNVECDAHELDLGQEVEYTLSARTGPGGKMSAENVKLLPKGTMPVPPVKEDVYEGTVVRPMRCVNPEQLEYCGLVCVGDENEDSGCFEFGITSVINKRELLQQGDNITFQIDETGRAVAIRAIRKKIIATVDAVKGQYGFLNYETEEGKKLFFHQTEVKDGALLCAGDEVEFVVITNQKTGKSSACNIVRLMSKADRNQRPHRLVSKLRSMNLDTSKPRIVVTRQPKGPDDASGFKLQRTCISTFSSSSSPSAAL